MPSSGRTPVFTLGKSPLIHCHWFVRTDNQVTHFPLAKGWGYDITGPFRLSLPRTWFLYGMVQEKLKLYSACGRLLLAPVSRSSLYPLPLPLPCIPTVFHPWAMLLVLLRMSAYKQNLEKYWHNWTRLVLCLCHHHEKNMPNWACWFQEKKDGRWKIVLPDKIQSIQLNMNFR